MFDEDDDVFHGDNLNELLLLQELKDRLSAGELRRSLRRSRPFPRGAGGSKLRSSVFDPLVPTGASSERSASDMVVIVFFLAPMMPLSDA